MINRPAKCCPVGSYECTVPMPIAGRVQGIDVCVAPIVAALNAANLRTMASCCGHGVMCARISLEDETDMFIVLGELPEIAEARIAAVTAQGVLL